MFQIAFGVIGLDYNTFWSMTPKEFFNAWIGFDDKQRDNRNVAFYLAQYNAVRTAFSTKQAQQTRRDKSPFEVKKVTAELNPKSVMAMLDLISK